MSFCEEAAFVSCELCNIVLLLLFDGDRGSDNAVFRIGDC